MIVALVDQRDIDRYAAQGTGSVEPAKPTTNDHHTRNHDRSLLPIHRMKRFNRLTLRPRRFLRSHSVYLAGTNKGAPLFFTKNTTNFAGLVLLAFRPTTR